MNKFSRSVVAVMAALISTSSPLISAQSQSAHPAGGKAPAYAASDYPTIYGSVIYANNFVGGGSEVGLYEVPTSESAFQLIFPGPGSYGGGFYRDGVYYSISYNTANGVVSTITGYDTLSGREIYSVESDASAIGHYAVDPLSNDIYGITFRPELGGYMLARIELMDDQVKVTRIKNLEGFWAAFAIDGTGQFYGISKLNASVASSEVANLYTIDRGTGATKLVGRTGGRPVDNTDATIDITTNRMFWATSSPDEGGQLLEVNLETAETTFITTFNNGQQVAGLYIPAPDALPSAPGECRNIEFTFNSPEMKGTMTLETPSTLFDGETPGSGDLYVIAITNSDQVGYEKVEWGKKVTIPIEMTDYEPGLYNFTVMAIGPGGEGPKSYLNNIFVGRDAPAATTATLAYVDGRMNLTWLPVTGSANGGYIDSSDITYTVKRNDGSVAASGLKTTSWSEAKAEPSTVTEVYYTVTATSGGLNSAPAKSNIVILGALGLPYTSNYASNPNLTGFTIIDGNEDGRTWSVQNGKAVCYYNQYENMNDWLITPPFKLQANHPYVLKFSANCYMSNSPERLEVKFGTSNTAAGMTETALEPTLVTNTANNPKEFECYITPKTTGNYFIGFHGISDAYMYQLYLSDFTIEQSASADNPGAPTNLTVEPDQSSALTARISFNAPKVTIAQEPLTSLTKAELYRGGTLIKTFNAPAPGALLTFDDAVTANGMYEYSAVAYNAEGKGMEASTSAFIGQDVPAAPEKVTVGHTDKVTEAIVTWTPVTTDRNGKPLFGEVTYTITRIAADGTSSVVAEGIKAQSYTFTATSTGTANQVFVQCEVSATSNAGTGEATQSDVIAVGTPYTTFKESFSDGAPSLKWGETRQSEMCRWEVYTDESGLDSQDNDDGFAAFYGVTRGETSMLYSGNIQLSSNIANPGLTFYLYNNSTETSNNRNIVKVMARGYNDLEWTPIFDKTVTEAANGREGWQKVTVDISKYANREFQLAFVGEVANYLYFFIDNIQIGSLPANDIAATRISAPFSVRTGTDYTVTVKVDNLGAKPASSFEVSLYANGKLYETQQGSTLEPLTSRDYNFTLHMAENATKSIDFNAIVNYVGDNDATNNNTDGVTVLPAYSDLPGATGLALYATETSTNVELSWNAAKAENVDGEPITQSFEDGDAFAATYGNWIFVDNDKSPVSGPADYDIPNVEYGVTTGSFWVWDSQQLPSSHFTAHSGDKFLFTLFRRDGGAADEWAISPELNGDAQTISFWARSVESTYPEKLEVYYSTGSTTVTDFVKVAGVGGNVPARWTEYTAKLPAGARRFAIRSCATDAMMLLVDDVTFIPSDALGGAHFNGYDIYRNNEKLTSSPIAECRYVDNDLAKGTRYSYNVVAVYDLAVAKPSNTATFTFGQSSIADTETTTAKVVAENGVITVENAEGRDVAIVTTNGLVLYAGRPTDTLRLRANNGVYIVSIDNQTKKLILK